MDLNEIIKIIETSNSINDCSLKIYGYQNGRTCKKLLDIIYDNDIDTAHFDNGKKQRKYDYITKECPICETKFVTQKGHKKEKVTCGTSCANRYRGKLTEQTKTKISKSLLKYNGNVEIPRSKCVNCGKEFELWKTEKSGRYTRSKTCSPKCESENRSKVSKENMTKVIAEGRHKGWTTRNTLSYPEKFFKKVLELNGFKGKFEINKMIKKRDLGLDCNSNYFLDFYFEDAKFDLEIDGKQHELNERKESDKQRDVALTKNEIEVYRIKWRSINTESGKSYMKKEIDNLIEILNKRLK